MAAEDADFLAHEMEKALWEIARAVFPMYTRDGELMVPVRYCDTVRDIARDCLIRLGRGQFDVRPVNELGKPPAP